jgi:hypothetical protein
VVKSRSYCDITTDNWDARNKPWSVVYHIVYCPTIVAVEFGTLKTWIEEQESSPSIEDTVYSLVGYLTDPWYCLARVFVAAEERHTAGWSRDVVSAEYSYTSELSGDTGRFDAVVNKILLGGLQ